MFAAAGYDVLAIDDDHDPDLEVSLGVAHKAEVPPVPDDFVERVDTPEDEPSWELTSSPQIIIDEYGCKAPDGVTLLKAGKVVADSGSFVASHNITALLLFNEERDSEDVTIVDMPAGLGVPGMAQVVDVWVMVVEPSYTSLETMRKLAVYGAEYDVADVRVIANNVRIDLDVSFIEDYCKNLGLEISTVIPNDDAIHHAESCGIAPIDSDDGSPAVCAIRELADHLDEIHGDRPVH